MDTSTPGNIYDTGKQPILAERKHGQEYAGATELYIILSLVMKMSVAADGGITVIRTVI